MLPTFRYKVGVVAQFLDYIEAGGECGGDDQGAGGSSSIIIALGVGCMGHLSPLLSSKLLYILEDRKC